MATLCEAAGIIRDMLDCQQCEGRGELPDIYEPGQVYPCWCRMNAEEFLDEVEDDCLDAVQEELSGKA